MKFKVLGLLALGLAVSMAARAETETLFYTGNDVTDVTGLPLTVSGNIHGYITLDAPLDANLSSVGVNPIAFSFNGGDPLSNLNASLSSFEFSTDASRNITGWMFGLLGYSTTGTTVFEGSAFYPAGADGSPANGIDLIQLNDSQGITLSPGTWTVATVAAPEIDPTSAISGLMLLLGSAAVLRGRTKVRVS